MLIMHLINFPHYVSVNITYSFRRTKLKKMINLNVLVLILCINYSFLKTHFGSFTLLNNIVL
jgi:hypothetical protein